jgi:hypothetical protein
MNVLEMVSVGVKNPVFLGCFLVFHFLFNQLHLMKVVLQSIDCGDSLQNGTGIFVAHVVELPLSCFSVKFLDRPRVRIEFADHLVELHVRESSWDFVLSVEPEGKRNALALVEFFQTFLNIIRIAYLYVIRE